MSEGGSSKGAGIGTTRKGIRALCARLVRLRVALVALERPDGLLIERLLDVGLSVVAVHPIRSRRAGRGTAENAGLIWPQCDGADSS